MTNYLYKTTDDFIQITIPDPPSIVPTPPLSWEAGLMPPPQPVSPPFPENPIVIVMPIDTDNDGIDDSIIACNSNGCSLITA